MKVFFFFRGELDTHVDLYLSWLIEKEIQITPITFISKDYFIRNRDLVKNYRLKGVKVNVTPWFISKLSVFFYFLIQIIREKELVIQTKKQNIKPLLLIKRVFKKRMKIIMEIEGDPWAELQYLQQKEKQIIDGMYDEEIKSLENFITHFKKTIIKLSHIFVVTDELKNTICLRTGYPRHRVTVKPTGYDAYKFYFDSNLREKKRNDLKIDKSTKVFIYSGNCFYSWQNLSRTVQIYNIYRQKFNQDAMLIILTRKVDLYLAKLIIAKNKMVEGDYILCNVTNDDVNEYLNAADVGVLLREKNSLNTSSAPGKLGEYLGAGLSLITSKHIGLFSKILENEKKFFLFDDIYSDDEFMSYGSYIELHSRYEISNWAKNNFSSSMFIHKYNTALQQVINE